MYQGNESRVYNNPHEADSCFGEVLEPGFSRVILDRVTKMPGSGFLKDPADRVLIDRMTILLPSSGDGLDRGGSSTGGKKYVEWAQSPGGPL